MKAALMSHLPCVSLCFAEPSLGENYLEAIAPVCRYFSCLLCIEGSRHHFSRLLCSYKWFVCFQRSLQ